MVSGSLSGGMGMVVMEEVVVAVAATAEDIVGLVGSNFG